MIPSMEDRISIVMITHNRGEQIRLALEQLLRLPERPRIIVVDNGSSDSTADIARATSSAVEVISLERNLGCAGRNVGAQRAETSYVAFSDDDSWWAPGALARAAELLNTHPRLGLIAAKILLREEERLDPLCQIMANTRLPYDSQAPVWSVGIPVVGFAACGAILRREAFLEAGGFNQRLGVGGEEQILALDLLRNGWCLAYVDEVIAHHYPSAIRDRARRRRLEARNALWSAWLRRPTGSTLAETWRIVKLSLRDQAYRAGILEAMLGLSWVLSARNPIPEEIDRQVRAAEKVFHAYYTPGDSIKNWW